MRLARILRLSMLSAGTVLILSAATLPTAMRGAGLWEVSKSADGHGGQRVCLADPALLTQWEHRGSQCTRVVVTSGIDKATVQYTCVGGGFGTSKVQVVTPRTLRIDSQGIAHNFPFAFVLHARRVGNC
jgi:hypothetical protein